MSPIQKYFAQAEANANERFLNVDGFGDDDMNFTADDEFFGAGGGHHHHGHHKAHRSQPYILNVVNASAAQVTNFDILGAFQYINNAGFSGGSLTILGVTISSIIPNVTYQELLYQSIPQPWTTGETLLVSINSSVNGQIQQPMLLTTKDANGNQASKILTPVIDPYQFQSGSLVLPQPYRIDGFTKLTTTILASANFNIYFYPSDNINLSRGLGKKPVSKEYSPAGIIRSSVAVVDGTKVKARIG